MELQDYVLAYLELVINLCLHRNKGKIRHLIEQQMRIDQGLLLYMAEQTLLDDRLRRSALRIYNHLYLHQYF